MLWLTLALFLDMTIGGLVGFLIDRRTNDLEMAISMVIATAICVLVVWVGVARRRTTFVRDLQDTLSRTVLRWRLGLLATLAASSVVVGIVGAASGNDSAVTSTFSSLAITVAIVLWLGQFAAVCSYAIVRRTR